MVLASGYSRANLTATWANSKPERSGVGKVKWRPAFGSTAQKTLAVPQRSYSLSRLASRPGDADAAARTSACNVTGFSSRQTIGWLASYGRSYVSSTSAIFEMYSSLRSATHHIFFPPRLEIVVKQQDADGLSSHSGYQSPLHRFFHYQPNGPAGATLRRVTADHRDNPLFLAIVQHFSRSGPRLLVEGAFEAAFLVTVRHIANCLRSQGNHAEIRGALTPLASWERAKA